MTTKIVRRIDSTIMPTQHPYMTGAWTPLHYFSGMAYVTPGDAYEAA